MHSGNVIIVIYGHFPSKSINLDNFHLIFIVVARNIQTFHSHRGNPGFPLGQFSSMPFFARPHRFCITRFIGIENIC